MTAVRIWVLRFTLVAILLPGIAAVAAGEDESKPYALELGVVGGAVFVDDDLAGSGGNTGAPTLGARIGGPFPLRGFTWFADGTVFETSTDTFRGDARAITGRIGLEVPFLSQRRNPFFVSLAGGATSITFDNATDFESTIVSAGIGQWIALGGTKYLRWEYRADHTLARDGLQGQDLVQPQLLIGFHWRRGVKAMPYRTPSHPAPAEVEPAPAPAQAPAPLPDTDGDGVSDDADRCPDTITGIEVDASGCARDADRDGVYDGLGMDKCPDTPPGAVVDVHGCPLDGDGDGVYDGLDRCPDTPSGTAVDESGCPLG
jgi:OOP family OmpA-OmpF porin